MTAAKAPPAPLAPLPEALMAPLIGDGPVPGVTQWRAARPGPHLGLVALIHGNELCGVHALARLAADPPPLRQGAVTLILANLAAYRRFDPARVSASRQVDEDMNRVWDPAVLDGPGRSCERDRARILRPIIDGLDAFLDLHSMTAPAEPLVLAGDQERSVALAQALGLGHMILVDQGHAAGRRLRDYGPFGAAAPGRDALLVECGQHVDPRSVDVAHRAALAFLAHHGVIDADLAAPRTPADGAPAPVVEVTETVTVRAADFRFLREFAGVDRLARAGTPFATEAGRTLVTPHDECFLIMPARQLAVGHTAVRLGRLRP